MFQSYVDGASPNALAAVLNREGVPCPSAHDAARNPHRAKTAWQNGAILRNPRYTGHEVWNKQRKEEHLIDVEEVTLGHRTRMAHKPEESGCGPTSPPTNRSSPPASSKKRKRPAANAPSGTAAAPNSTPPPATAPTPCAAGSGARWREEDAARRHPRQRLLAVRVPRDGPGPPPRPRPPPHRVPARRHHHPAPRPVDRPRLHSRPAHHHLHRADPRHRHSSQAAAAGTPEENQARRTPQECDKRLARYRAALAAGADPTFVTRWINDAQSDKRTALARLKKPESRRRAQSAWPKRSCRSSNR
ncbi:recombinase family protein [Streptomyces sp. NPDC002644]